MVDTAKVLITMGVKGPIDLDHPKITLATKLEGKEKGTV